MHDYGFLSLLPSLLAIGMALLTRQVFIALFSGVWAGAWIVGGGDLSSIISSFFKVADTYLIRAIVPENGSPDHMFIIMFTLLTGGMIGVITANGGLHGIVKACSAFVSSPKGVQGATAGFGSLIFFDDYANMMIVGNGMRPMADKAGVSREKLAYIVDSTAAPMACIALVTTWIGFQISLIKDVLGDSAPAFEMMVAALAYSFYPILAILFIVLVILTGRDFGPMLKAEKRARKNKLSDELIFNDQDSEMKEKTANKNISSSCFALLPVITLIAGVMVGLFVTGEGDDFRDIMGSADPFKSMLWASLAGLFVAVFMSVVFNKLTIVKTVEAVERGFIPMFSAIMVLAFAWAIADLNKEMKTAEFIISYLSDGVFAPMWLPVLVFLIAAATSFATGTSWGAIGILVPLVLPLSINIMGYDGDIAAVTDDILMQEVVIASLAAVLGGAVWGDHCSPISDTTILSSVACSCSHIEHVRTQMPYAIVVSVVAVTLGMIPALLLDIPVFISFILCVIALYCFLKFIGEKV